MVLAAVVLAIPALGEKLPRQRDLDRLSEAIRAKRWGEAVKGCDDVRRKARDLPTARPLPSRFFAELFARCAVAKAGAQAEAEEVSWHLHVAHFFDSDAARQVVMEVPLGLDLPEVRPASGIERDATGRTPEAWVHSLSGERIDAKLPVARVHPMPSILPQRGAQLRLTIEYVIGTDGRLRQPRWVSGQDVTPAQALAILETHRGWQFDPATTAGGPVAVLYALTTLASRGG